MYNSPLYREYVREVPPKKWAPKASDRIESWQRAFDRPQSNMNTTEYARPTKFMEWLKENYPTEWISRLYPQPIDRPLTISSRGDYKKKKNVWGRYTILLLPEEVFTVRSFLRLALGKPDKEGIYGGMLWEAHDIVLMELPAVASHNANHPILSLVWDIVKETKA